MGKNISSIVFKEMKNSNQDITLEIVLKSLEDDFDTVERARIFQKLRNTEINDDALLGAKMILEDNNWDYSVLKKHFSKAETRIDTIVNNEKKALKSRTNYLKYVAIFVSFIAIGTYFLMQNNKTIDNYYIEEPGLPNLMSNEKINDWNRLMQFYKTKQNQSAFDYIQQMELTKPKNDSIYYFKAIIAYDLKKYNIAEDCFLNVVNNKQSEFYYDAEFRLGFALFKNKNIEEAKKLFEKIKNENENPFAEEANTILKSAF